MCRSRGGREQGVRTTPLLKTTQYRVSISNTGPDPMKNPKTTKQQLTSDSVWS